jgi:hypothetical protein
MADENNACITESQPRRHFCQLIAGVDPSVRALFILTKIRHWRIFVYVDRRDPYVHTSRANDLDR